MIRLPVSIGEALDKLSILELKCNKIRDIERLGHCKTEYNLLYKELEKYLDANQYSYSQLYAVNEMIWDMQDEIRIRPDPQKCVEILDKNDMRFRIKDVINQATKSYIREQKGYPKRRALVIGHMGLGDMVGMNGAIRYIAQQHDETVVVCLRGNVENVYSFFNDNPTIRIRPIDQRYLPGKWPHGIPPDDTPGECLEYDPADFASVYRFGYYKKDYLPHENLPVCFYRDLGFDPAIRHTHFFIPQGPGTTTLYNYLKGSEYNFVQQVSSSHTTSTIRWNIDERLTIDPNQNVYPAGHRWHAFAQKFVNQPITDYLDVLRNATEIHVVDSVFYCLACYIGVKAKVKVCYKRETGEVDPQYQFT